MHHASIIGQPEMVKLLVVGHARHGKDTFCEYLRDYYGYKFVSSSEFCAEKVIFPVLSPIYGYKTVKECFDDRSNHRLEWFNLISDYNASDPARLGRDIFAESDIYCGLRNSKEMEALKAERAYDISIWVDASLRVPLEDSSSNTISKDMIDYLIDNNGTQEEFETEIKLFIRHYFY
jgi:hypothetical protein